MTRWRTRHRGTRSDRGAAAVEFAIVLVVLLLIIFAIIDFGRLLFVTQAVKSASREAARAAVIRDTDWTDAKAVASNSVSTANGLAAGGTSPTITWVGGTTGQTSPQDTPGVNPCTAAGASVTASVKVDFKWLTPIGILPGAANSNLTGSRPVGASTTMRCE